MNGLNDGFGPKSDDLRNSCSGLQDVQSNANPNTDQSVSNSLEVLYRKLMTEMKCTCMLLGLLRKNGGMMDCDVT